MEEDTQVPFSSQNGDSYFFIGTAFMSHLFAPENKDVSSAVNSLKKQMMNNCGYMVNRSKPIYLFLDVLLTIGLVVFLFLFGKIPGLVLAVYPSNI